MYVIETCGLAKAYRGRRVVDGFGMHVAEGDIYGFVGKNGAGKSTVMRMIDGLAAPTISGCDYIVRIPMSHGTDSLNVAAASAVAFWQLRKQG